MKKSILLLLVAAMLASAPLFAQIGITAGVEADFGDVANEDREKNAIPFALTPIVEYKNSFGDLDLDVILKVPLKFISNKDYAGVAGTDYTDMSAAPPEKPEPGTFHADLYLEEDFAYNLAAGPGTLSIGLNNANSFQMAPAAPHKDYSRWPRTTDYPIAGGDADGFVGINGTVAPRIKYAFPVAGTLAATFKLPIVYAVGSTPVARTKEDYGAALDLVWVLDWESEFGLGVEYEGGTGGSAALGGAYGGAGGLVDHDTANSDEGKTALVYWKITPRYVIIPDTLTAKLKFGFTTWAGSETKPDDWEKANGLVIEPLVEYKIAGATIEAKAAIGHIGEDKDKGGADVSITPVLTVKYGL